MVTKKIFKSKKEFSLNKIQLKIYSYSLLTDFDSIQIGGTTFIDKSDKTAQTTIFAFQTAAQSHTQTIFLDKNRI